MFIRRAPLVTAVVACCIGAGYAAGATTKTASLASLKEPRAATAQVRGLRFVYGPATTAVAAGSIGVATPAYSIARCPKRLHALSGGWNSDDTTNDPVTVTSNEVGRGDVQWIVVAKDTSTDDTSPGFTFQATVLCG